MPKPKSGESKEDFVSRCMSSSEAQSDFPDQDQRFAFCNSAFEKGSDMSDTDESTEVDLRAKVLKVDDSLGLVMGYAIVCKVDGEEYYDLQGDHITEDAMMTASLDFMENSRVAKEMHAGDQTGTFVFAWPMTTEIAKAFGIETKTTGLMIAVRPDPDMLAKFRDGTYTGFSIGGHWLQEET